MNKERIKRIRGIPFLLRLISPSYSHCAICGLPWNHTETHVVQLNEHEGFFAVCEYCHQHASTEELIKAYRRSYMKYWGGTKFSWNDYVRAIEKDRLSIKRNLKQLWMRK